MAGPFGDLADGWEENQTLVGGVLFFLCPLLQIPSYCFSCPMQEKSVPFFTARCMSYCFYGEIFICGDCAVATPFKMPSNSSGDALHVRNQYREPLRGEISGVPGRAGGLCAGAGAKAPQKCRKQSGQRSFMEEKRLSAGENLVSQTLHSTCPLEPLFL